MGGGASAVATTEFKRRLSRGSLFKADAESIPTPPFYVKEPDISEDDQERIRHSWSLIVSETASEYILHKRDVVEFSAMYPNCIMWFYTTFYNKLFEKHPNFKSLFKNDIESQGRMLSGMVTKSIEWMGKNEESFTDTLITLVRRHAEFGVKAHMYGEMLDVLFWSLSHCLGPEEFTSEISHSWAKGLSKVLHIFVVEAVSPHFINLHSFSAAVTVSPQTSNETSQSHSQVQKRRSGSHMEQDLLVPPLEHKDIGKELLHNDDKKNHPEIEAEVENVSGQT